MNTQQAKANVNRKINEETGLLEDVKERIVDFADTITEKVKDKSADLWEDAQEKSKDTWKDVKTFVRKNPGESLGIAFAAGLFAYALLNRKD